MKPIYFPFTHISKPVVDALGFCFRQSVVYQPARFTVSENLENWSQDGVLEVRIPFEGDEERLAAILKDYREWAKLHHGSRGLQNAFTRKLFETVHPQRAYFGQKDFQQLVIVRHLVQELRLDLEIVACPIVREKDGLALSSRNLLLSREHRKIAPFIHQTLQKAYELRESYSPSDLKAWVIAEFDQQPLMQLEYFEIVEDKALRPVKEWSENVNKVGCIAVLLGEIRLIDNLFFN